MSGIVRIKDLDTAEELTSGDYLAVDGAGEGLRKVQLKPITDDISDLKSAIVEISTETRNLNNKGCGRYNAKSTTGVITKDDTNNNIVGMSDKIPCLPSTNYTVTFFDIEIVGATIYAYFYDTDGVFLSRLQVNNVRNNKATFTTVETASHVYFCAYNNGITLGQNPRIQVEKGSVSTSYIAPVSALDLTARSEAEKIIDGLNTSIDTVFVPGYYNSNGVISAQSETNLELTTSKINASIYSSIVWNLTYSASKSAWLSANMWDSDGTFTRQVLINTEGLSFSGVLEIPVSTQRIAFSFRSFGEDALSLTGEASIQSFVKVSEKNTVIDNTQIQSSIGANSNRFKPYYDHLFIDKINGSNVTIPSESLFNIQISRRLGFDMIEANVQPTSDDNFIVMHGVSGKFGQQVEHIDGETDISNIAINSVTLSWIKTNVRYKSLYPKYRVAPPSLEEFLYECRKNCMIPMVTARNSKALEIINNIMGVGNYVAYNGERDTTSAPILTYPTLTSKEEILNHCHMYGVPYMYCMANPTSFTDSQLTEIVSALHSEGYWIGYAGSYETETEAQRLWALGFDFCASKYQINEFESGNLCNLSADIDYADFATTGTVTDNLLTLQNGDTLAANATLPSVFLGGASLHIRFSGTITIVMGRYINTSITSDGVQSLWFSTYYLNQEPTFLITATSETQIINLDFKASKM